MLLFEMFVIWCCIHLVIVLLFNNVALFLIKSGSSCEWIVAYFIPCCLYVNVEVIVLLFTSYFRGSNLFKQDLI